MACPTEGKSRFEEAMDTYIDDLCDRSLEERMKDAQLNLENLIQESAPQMYNNDEFFLDEEVDNEVE